MHFLKIRNNKIEIQRRFIMKKILSHIVAALSLIVALTSCADLNTDRGQALAIRSGIGAGLGAAVGQAVGRNTESTLIGAGIGAVVGGVTGGQAGRVQEYRGYRPREQHHPPHNGYYGSGQGYYDSYSRRNR